MLVAVVMMFKLEVSHEKNLELKAQHLFWMCETEVTAKEKHGSGMWSKNKVQKGSSWQRFERKQMCQDDFLQSCRRGCCSNQNVSARKGRDETFCGAVSSIKSPFLGTARKMYVCKRQP